MKYITTGAVFLALLLAYSAVGDRGGAQAQMMDQGMGSQMMVVPMVDPSVGAPGGLGPGVIYGWPDPARNALTVDQVREMMEQLLAWHRNPNLKVGEIAEQDENTIVAEIVTADGSLVQRLEVDRHSGLIEQVD